MARTKNYVVYTREFRGGDKEIGVFADPVTKYTSHGGVDADTIQMTNEAVADTARKTPTNKLLQKGRTFKVNVLGVAPIENALEIKSGVISLLRKSGRKVINKKAPAVSAW